MNSFHRLQIELAAIIGIVCFLLYAIVPDPTKAQTLAIVGTSCLSFLFGKFTNGFPKPQVEKKEE